MLSYLGNNKALLYSQAIAENLMHSWRTEHIYWYFNFYFILMPSVLELETSLLWHWGHTGFHSFLEVSLLLPFQLIDAVCAQGKKKLGPTCRQAPSVSPDLKLILREGGGGDESQGPPRCQRTSIMTTVCAMLSVIRAELDQLLPITYLLDQNVTQFHA